MDTEVAVKPEPTWLIEDEEELPRMKSESVPVPITFPCVKTEFITRDINHGDAKNEAVLFADVCDEGNRISKSDIDTEEKCLLGDNSQCNYSAGEMDTVVTVKPESMWLEEDKELRQARVKDEGIVSAANCDEINEELKTEIDIEENCILEDSSEFVQSINGAGDANLMEKEGIIFSSTEKLEAVERCMAEYEEQFTVYIDKNIVRKVNNKKYSQEVHNTFSKCALTSETQFNCDICGKSFKTYSDIVRHINSHISRKPFKCEVCNKCITQSRNLKIHMRLHKGNKPFKCKECSKCFTQSSNLKQHLMTHTGERPFKCKECNKCFTKSSHLTRHMMTHTREKPFECKECSKCFTQSGDLKQHLMTHTGEKPFKCKECSKSFNQSGSLKQHVMTHTGEKPFKCKECSVCCTSSGNLKNHLMTHTGEKPFECKECSKCFSQSSNLTRHMRAHK